jgi:hypothetical protein
MGENMTHEPGEQDSHEYMGALQDFQSGKTPEPKIMNGSNEEMETARKATEETEAE